MEDRRIFKVVGGKAAELVAQREDQIRRHGEALAAFLNAHGVTRFWGSNLEIWGVCSESKPKTPGWRRHSKEDQVWVAGSGKDGRALDLTMRAIRAIVTVKAESFFTGDSWVCTLRHMFTPGCGTVNEGGAFIVTIHRDAKAKPIDGLEEIKLSEYYAMIGK
jgi:hypothetical protein